MPASDDTPRRIIARFLSWVGVAVALGVTACSSDATRRPHVAPVEDASPDGQGTVRRDAGRDADTPLETRGNVLTQHNDALRTGATLDETTLSPNVVRRGLTEVGRFAVGAEVYAQPLYVNRVQTPFGPRDLLIVATMEDTVFAFDVNGPSGAVPVWAQGQQHELGIPAFSARNINGNHGILGTPTIDKTANTLYLVARDCDPDQPPETPSCQHRLFALDLRDGSVQRSVAVAGSVTNRAGKSVSFDSNAEWQRTGLLLQGGRIFIAFAAGPNGSEHEEDFEFHGWVMAYGADDFSKPPAVHCTTADLRAGGGIWQSGNGLAGDGTGVYFATGNGVAASSVAPPSAYPESPLDQEDSIVRIVPRTDDAFDVSRVFDDRAYHADGNVFQYMESHDIDLGTSGPALIPGTHQLVTLGKSGIVYVVDRDTMTFTQPPLSAFTAPPLPSGQSLYIASYEGGPHANGSAVVWRPDAGPGQEAYALLFAWPQNDHLKALKYSYATRQIEVLAQAQNAIQSMSGMLSLSADHGDSGSGIVWATTRTGSGPGGELTAFAAETLEPLWQVSLPYWAKFVPPTVAGGKVFVVSTGPRAPASERVVLAYAPGP